MDQMVQSRADREMEALANGFSDKTTTIPNGPGDSSSDRPATVNCNAAIEKIHLLWSLTLFLASRGVYLLEKIIQY